MNHTLNHYLIGGAALLMSAVALGGGTMLAHRLENVHVSHMAYAGLSDAQAATLSSALATLGKHDVVIWCAGVSCGDLSEDLQYAAYQADWDTHSAPMSISGLPKGINVAPDNPAGRALAKAIEQATGRPVGFTAVDPRDATDLSIVIGEK